MHVLRCPKIDSGHQLKSTSIAMLPSYIQLNVTLLWAFSHSVCTCRRKDNTSLPLVCYGIILSCIRSQACLRIRRRARTKPCWGSSYRSSGLKSGLQACPSLQSEAFLNFCELLVHHVLPWIALSDLRGCACSARGRQRWRPSGRSAQSRARCAVARSMCAAAAWTWRSAGARCAALAVGFGV